MLERTIKSQERGPGVQNLYTGCCFTLTCQNDDTFIDSFGV